MEGMLSLPVVATSPIWR